MIDDLVVQYRESNGGESNGQHITSSIHDGRIDQMVEKATDNTLLVVSMMVALMTMTILGILSTATTQTKSVAMDPPEGRYERLVEVREQMVPNSVATLEMLNEKQSQMENK